ncbi:MAG: nitrite reductase (NAD(P)H) small subunit [Actinomycetota bacterium]|nr:nitrite reductase (NAD(P)H) small subunit [Actinomycetota bacterium]
MSTVAATSLDACAIDDIPLGEGRAITLEGRRVAIFRAAGGWYALDAVCPHRGGPLADGIVCDRAVICPLHDRRFDLASGAPLTTGDGVAAHSVEVRGERIFVTLAAGMPRAA